MKIIQSLCIASAMTFSMNASAIDLDLFTDAGFVEDNTANSSAVTQDNFGAGIFGGVRNISVDLITDNSGSTNNSVKMDIFGGVLSFSNDDPSGGEGRVQWNGTAGFQDLETAGNFGLNGADFAAEGDGFTIDVLTVDLGFVFTVEAYTDEMHFTKVTIRADTAGSEFFSFANLESGLGLCSNATDAAADIANGIAADATGVLAIECYETATPGVFQTVDMSAVGALQTYLNVDGQQVAVDLSIGPIKSTVPEPTTVALLGMGLIGAGASKLRRKK